MSETPHRFSAIEALESLGQDFGRLEEAPARRTPLHRRRTVRVLALSAAGAAALVAVALLRTSSDSEGTATADSFSSLAAIAAEQPSGLEYVKWSSKLRYLVPGGGLPSGLKSALEVQLWGDEDVRFQESVNDLSDSGLSRIRDLSLIDRPYGAFCYSDERTNPRRTIAEPAACTHLSGPFDPAGLGALLPTDATRLKMALEDFDEDYRDLNLQYLKRIGDAGGKPTHEDCSLHGITDSFVPPSASSERSDLLGDLDALPAHVTQSAGGGFTYTYPPVEDLFTAAIFFLADPSANPELRAGIFRVLAELPNTHLTADAVDQLGRPATVVEYRIPKGDPSFKRYGLDEIYLDPTTSEVLELRTSVFEPAHGDDAPEVVGTYDRVFTDREQVDSLPTQAQPLEDALSRAKRTCGPAS